MSTDLSHPATTPDFMLPLGERLADKTVAFFGSWPFIIWQTIFVAIWMAVNAAAVGFRWDPYPFILLNLAFSTQAAYAAPLVMIAQKRHAQTTDERDTADHYLLRQIAAQVQGIHDNQETGA